MLFCLHAIVAGASAYVFAGRWSALWLPVVVAVSHVVVDSIDRTRCEATGRLLLAQAGHLAVVTGCWVLLTGLNVWLVSLWISLLADSSRAWTLALAYAIMIWPASTLVGRFTKRWREHEGVSEPQGLENAGLWIGRLERVLALTFVLIGRFEAIGFLVAAKSVFRFGELRDPTNRREAEYILIGTLASFSLAICTGIVARLVVAGL